MTALYADDAVIVTDTGPIQGREAISKHFEDLFQNVHFSNHVVTVDAYSPHIIGTTGNEIRWNGSWTTTLQVKGSDPVQAKGYWSMVSSRRRYLEVPDGNVERHSQTVKIGYFTTLREKGWPMGPRHQPA